MTGFTAAGRAALDDEITRQAPAVQPMVAD